MNRLRFIKYMGASTLATSVSSILHASPAKIITVNDLQKYLRSLYVIEGNSVDQIIIGNPESRITKIGTCWMPYWQVLKEAVALGVNTIITHEPTFYTHYDLKQIDEVFKKYPDAAKKAYLAQVERKKKWIEENEISIIRCHDVLDILPKTGIPYALGMALGFSNEDIIRSEPFYNVYKIKETTAKNAARHISSKLAIFGQKGVEFYGDENRIIRSVGVGTGAICDPVRFMHLDADLRIAIDDSVTTWTQTYLAQDSGDPLVIINHGTAEEYGIRIFSAHLKQVFTDLEVIHFNEGCGYKWIS